MYFCGQLLSCDRALFTLSSICSVLEPLNNQVYYEPTIGEFSNNFDASFK
ncbi:hypothetical protein FHS68_005293 [Dyadobacter arcticus]|uniref:Uncharacterized protein n=1 Tax=Dyadobacter arcticus TaxID=1078754 RepID=A0ABX0UUN5_9BACT|nr:hypothetical protein [Dyadobacter arcticus]